MPYVNYQWRTTVKVTTQITPPTRGWVDLTYTSVKAGGSVTTRFYTVEGANLPLNANVYVYGCAPNDAVQWGDAGSSSSVMLWDFNAQDNIFITPTNTMVSCP